MKHSGRRAFLRTAGGLAMGLPLLEYTHGHLWGSARSVQNDATRRFITIFLHGGTISNVRGDHRDVGANSSGVVHDWWRPDDPTTQPLGRVHAPLQPWKEKLLLLEGIDNKAAIKQHKYHSGGHFVANALALSAADVSADDGSTARSLGPSIDHVVAQRLNARQSVPFENLHLRVFPYTGEGSGYGSPYYRNAHEVIEGERSPTSALGYYFDGVSNGTPNPQIVHQNARRTLLLDGLQGAYAGFHARVSARDRQTIDAHLDHLSQLEKQLADPIVCTVPGDSGVSATQAGDQVASAMAQLLVAAIRCGLTNVANLEISDMTAPWTPNAALRSKLSFEYDVGHSIGHHANEVGPSGSKASEHDDFMVYWLENQHWRMQVIAQVLAGLDDATFGEGDETILDNSLVLVTSEFSNAGRHVSYNAPVLLAGSVGGYFDTGRFVTYDEFAGTAAYQSAQSTHNLFTSILQAMGEDDTHFGNGDADVQGPLPDLTG